MLQSQTQEHHLISMTCLTLKYQLQKIFPIFAAQDTFVAAHFPPFTLADATVASSGTCHCYPEWHDFPVYRSTGGGCKCRCSWWSKTCHILSFWNNNDSAWLFCNCSGKLLDMCICKISLCMDAFIVWAIKTQFLINTLRQRQLRFLGHILRILKRNLTGKYAHLVLLMTEKDHVDRHDSGQITYPVFRSYKGVWKIIYIKTPLPH